MKTSRFSGFAVATLLYSLVLTTAILGFYCYKQFYLNHLKIVSASRLEKNSVDSLEFVRVNNTAEASQVDSVSKEENASTGISPPFPSLDPISKNIYLHTNTGITFVSKNNTRIEVSPFAFVDEEGNTIDAEVEMQYREFLRPHDIFLSGIPMKYDSSNTLTTQCLFEINASTFGKPVYINPQKPFTVTLPSDTGTGKLYYFDNEKQSWNADSINDAYPENSTPDDIRLSRSMILPKYAIALKCKTKMELKRERFLGKKKAPDHFIFTFLNFADQFPEFNELKNTNWVYDDFDALQNYYRIFSPGQEDVYAEEVIYCDSAGIVKTGDSYTLKISGKNRNAELSIRPFTVNATDELNFELAYESYLSSRENRFAAESQLMAMLNSIHTDSMAEAPEIVLPISQSKFTIDKFGIWNYGKTVNNNSYNTVHAVFVDEAGRTIDVRKGWMTMKNVNALFCIDDFEKLSLKPATRIFFWTIFPDNKIGIVYPEEFKRRSVNGKVTYKIRIYEDREVLRNKLCALL